MQYQTAVCELIKFEKFHTFARILLLACWGKLMGVNFDDARAYRHEKQTP